jgi:hypothetical protein
MTAETLPDGPDLETMLQLIRDEFADAVVATRQRGLLQPGREALAELRDRGLDHEHDEGAPSNLARDGVYRVNVGVDRETFQRLVGSMAEP